ncbi:hypothetical protein NGM37_58915, partial [Streptomyces sp. TRM76130]|nr:hypothetical protein [Streptomyces sp. TRM76130]
TSSSPASRPVTDPRERSDPATALTGLTPCLRALRPSRPAVEPTLTCMRSPEAVQRDPLRALRDVAPRWPHRAGGTRVSNSADSAENARREDRTVPTEGGEPAAGQDVPPLVPVGALLGAGGAGAAGAGVGRICSQACGPPRCGAGVRGPQVWP